MTSCFPGAQLAATRCRCRLVSPCVPQWTGSFVLQAERVGTAWRSCATKPCSRTAARGRRAARLGCKAVALPPEEYPTDQPRQRPGARLETPSMSRPKAVVCDVNGTLFPMTALGASMAKEGLRAEDVELLFARVLRDGFAATTAGGFASFREIAAYHLQVMLAGAGQTGRDAESAAERILAALNSVQPYEDVRPGLERLHNAGIRVAAMTNGSTAIAQGLFERGGMSHLVDAVLDVSEPGAWKPHEDAYLHVLTALDPICSESGSKSENLENEEVMMVAVHPWDINGAKRLGMQAAFINRSGAPYPPFFAAPDLTASSLEMLADMLVPS